ncbi:MAG: leucine-rich repeat protein, partial [Spirochaetaceae bacterium]|nr:leucine-rich repeat protein [Spirochaetaceae bacterium]
MIKREFRKKFLPVLFSVLALAISLYSCKAPYAEESEVYTITIDKEIVNGSLSTQYTSSVSGEQVRVFVKPKYGYKITEESLVYILDGKVYPIRGERFFMPRGNIKITCKFENDISFALDASESAITLLKGDTFSPIPVAINFGQNANIRKIHWESSNTEVASVNATGLVECHDVGHTEIIATLEGTETFKAVKINIVDVNLFFDPITGLVTGYEPGSLQGAVLSIPNYIGNEKVMGVGDLAFENSTDFEAVNFNENCLFIGENAFRGSSVSYVQFNGSSLLGNEAFAFCPNLTTVKAKNDLSLTNTSFQHCKNLTKIEMSFDKIPGKYSNGQWKDYFYHLGTPESHRIIAGECENGKVSTVYGWAEAGSTVSVTLTPDDKYVYTSGSLTLTDNEGNAIPTTKSSTHTFVMPDSDVTISAKFEIDKNHVEFFHVDENGNTLNFPGVASSLRDGKDLVIDLSSPVGYEVTRVQYR